MNSLKTRNKKNKKMKKLIKINYKILLEMKI